MSFPSVGFGYIQGLPGDPGASAYEIAVTNGFVGTEQEWLDSAPKLDSANIFTKAQSIQGESNAASLGVELTTNGAFTGDATGWTLGQNWAYGANNVIITLDGVTEGMLSQTIDVISGISYLIEWSQTNSMANNGSIKTIIGTVEGIYVCPTDTSPALMSQVITANATDSVMLSFAAMDATSTGTITIGAVTVKSIISSLPQELFKDLSGITRGSLLAIGAGNLSFGADSQQYTTTGYDNSNIGNAGQRNLTIGYGNSNVGAMGQQLLITGHNNSNVGSSGQQSLTTGNDNSNVGSGGQQLLTTGVRDSNIGASGQGSLTTGSGNSNVGVDGQRFITTGNSNSNVGASGQESLTTGNNNSNIGDNGQQSLLTGNNNSNVGVAGQYNLTTGVQNNNFGVIGQRYLTTGSNNSSYGSQGFCDLTTGNNNSGIGNNTGRGIVTGSNNSILGAEVAGLDPDLTNNVILATGDGAIRAQFNGTSWSIKSGISVNMSALATTATAGFLEIPSCPGAPIGVPTLAYIGSVPLVVDSINNRLYIYINSIWKYVSLT